MAWLPLPEPLGESIGRGENIMEGLLRSKAGQAQLAQQQAQAAQEWQKHLHDYALQQQQEQRLAEIHPHLISNYQRMAEQHPLELQNLMSQISQRRVEIQKTQHEMNPVAQARAKLEIVRAFTQGQNIPQPGQGMPQPGQGMPQPGQTAPQGQEQPVNNEALGEFIKALTGGYNPIAETREQKGARELREHIAKKEAEADIEKTTLSPSTVSKLQEETASLQKVIPEMDMLINMTPQTYTLFGTTADEAYDALTFTVADALVKARDLPQTQASIDKMHHTLKIGRTELRSNYKKRMKGVREELQEREDYNLNLLENKKIRSRKLRGRTKEGEEVSVYPRDKEAFIKLEGTIL